MKALLVGLLVLEPYDSRESETGGSGTFGEANSTLYSTQIDPVEAVPVEVTW